MISFLSIIAVGFILGMRHATDPDHVIAITTIVSRQRKVTRAALTGIFWGVGHTLTIFVMGNFIILFGIVIPARVGLSMECGSHPTKATSNDNFTRSRRSYHENSMPFYSPCFPLVHGWGQGSLLIF